MAITNTRLTTTDATTVFSAVESQEAVVVIYLCNTSGNSVNINMYVLPGDGSTAASVDSQIYSDLQLTANDTYVISTEKLILDKFDEVIAEANIADCVTVTVSSVVL